MYILFISTTAWFIAQLIKVLSYLFFNNEFKPALLFSSGGMPSAHSAFVTSLTTQIALIHGINSDIFAISASFAAVVIYDAFNVRHSVGLHGETLNNIINYIVREEDSPEIQTLKVVLGHTPLQVFFGTILGVFHILILNWVGLI